MRIRATSQTKGEIHEPKPLVAVMNFVVLVLAVVLIVWISYDTFNQTDLLASHEYMTFQFWVCIVFILDFFVELAYSRHKWRHFWHRIVFLLLSIPYLNIISLIHIPLGPDGLYFIRFVPLARGALALAIVMGYLSRNAITSLFISYLSIILLVTYFCSLIFYQQEADVNPMVDTYWTALWWSAMNMTTVGCDISPVTIAGKIVAVVLPMFGMIIFPLFTVYLTDYVTRTVRQARRTTHYVPKSTSEKVTQAGGGAEVTREA